MYTNFLVEQGIELELNAGVYDLVDFLDDYVPSFACGDYGFTISSGKGIIDSTWKLQVRPRELSQPEVKNDPIGFIMVEKMDRDVTRLTIPPHAHCADEGEELTELEAKLFLSFICQTLNGLQDNGLIDLPYRVPVE